MIKSSLLKVSALFLYILTPVVSYAAEPGTATTISSKDVTNLPTSNIMDILLNPFFYVPFLTFVIGQTVKFVLQLIKGEYDLKYLVASGGMPSVHTATTVSLATTAVLMLGPSDPLAAVLLIFAGIVVYDSFGVRRSAGEQAVLLNRLIADLEKQHELLGKYKKIREVLGHKPGETLVGGVLGVAMGWLFVKYPDLLRIVSIDKLFSVPIFSQSMLRGFVVFFGGLTVWAVIFRIWSLGKKYKGVRQKFYKKIFVFTLSGGLFGLLYGLLAFQQASVLSFPFWFIAGIILWFAWGINLSSYYYKKYQKEHDEWTEQERKNKWLT